MTFLLTFLLILTGGMKARERVLLMKKGSAQSWMDRNAGTGTSVNGNASGREVTGGGGGREVSGEGGGRDDGGGGMALEATLSAPLTRYLPVASVDLSPARVH